MYGMNIVFITGTCVKFFEDKKMTAEKVTKKEAYGTCCRCEKEFSIEVVGLKYFCSTECLHADNIGHQQMIARRNKQFLDTLKRR